MFFRRLTLLVFLSVTLILHGCILERIFRVKDQLCDFERNFQIDTSRGFRVILREPVMLDKDITWLAGAEPTDQELAGDTLVMTYIAERNGMPSNRQYDLPIELRFVRLAGKYRLKEGFLSKNLADVLTDELLTQIMRSVCKSQKSLVNQQIIIDIRTLDRTLLPDRSKISAILGPSNPDSSNDLRQIYDYQLKKDEAVDKEIVIEIVFDDTGEQILRIKVKYLRYNLAADFEKGEAVLKVDIFVEQKT